ncbi:MAG: nicotinate (nicotinamide) nucleotide adenylyltransferase [Elusimicrobia bacterium]|nr:nicotinate (nicotinamide) nucleotide adenylyltransferase [Elusimicrobiota bacterium]
MRIALFGGTFNPIHYGHLALAEAARVERRLARVIFIPAGAPPHKTRDLASAVHRLAMVRLAIRGNPAFSVSDWEMRQARPSYTHETIQYFQQRFPGNTLYFLIGSDTLREIDTWVAGRRVLALCPFLVGGRPEASSRQLSPSLRRRVHWLANPLVNLNATTLRDMVRRRASLRYLVPDSVAAYIQRYRLYR